MPLTIIFIITYVVVAVAIHCWHWCDAQCSKGKEQQLHNDHGSEPMLACVQVITEHPVSPYIQYSISCGGGHSLSFDMEIQLP